MDSEPAGAPVLAGESLLRNPNRPEGDNKALL